MKHYRRFLRWFTDTATDPELWTVAALLGLALLWTWLQALEVL